MIMGYVIIANKKIRGRKLKKAEDGLILTAVPRLASLAFDELDIN